MEREKDERKKALQAGRFWPIERGHAPVNDFFDRIFFEDELEDFISYVEELLEEGGGEKKKTQQNCCDFDGQPAC